MFGTAVISLVGAASQLLIMVVLGIPLALPVFVLSFFLCFIPYIGGFISTGIAFLLTIAFGSTVDIAIMGIWTIVFNIVTGNIVAPLVYGRTVHIHPAIVLVAIPAGGGRRGHDGHVHRGAGPRRGGRDVADGARGHGLPQPDSDSRSCAAAARGRAGRTSPA